MVERSKRPRSGGGRRIADENGAGACDLKSIGQCGKHQQEFQKVEAEDDSKQLWSLLQLQLVCSWSAHAEEQLHYGLDGLDDLDDLDDLGIYSPLPRYFTRSRRGNTPLLHSPVGMVPRPPADVPKPAMTLDDTTPMGSSTALTFIKPKRDRTKVHPAASINNGSTNALPDTTPLAERINANKPHAFATSQSPLPVPGTYGSKTCAPAVEHVTHHASHPGGRSRNSILLAEDIRPGTPERTRLGSSFRSIGRLRLDATSLQRARSPMLPPPVPASTTRQPQSTDTIDSVIDHEVPHNAESVTLTEGSGEQHLPERQEQNEEQNENESILGERSPLTESEAGDHEELAENSLAQTQVLQEALPILATPQVVTEQTALGEYLVAHAEESAQAEKRWKDASVDEWKAGAQEMRDRLVKIIDFTKNHMKRKLDTYRSIQESIDGHKERVSKRQRLLDNKATAVTETATKMLTQIRCRNSL